MFVVQYLLAVLVILWIRYLWIRRRFYALYFKIPYAFGYPFLGVVWELHKFEETFKKTKRYTNNPQKSCLIWLGTNAVFLIRNPKLCEDILTSPFCLNKGFMYKDVSKGIGDNLITSGTPKWNIHKRLLTPAFKQSTILTFLPIINDEINCLQGQFAQFVGNGGFDLHLIIEEAILFIAGKISLGSSFSKTNKETMNFIQAFKELKLLGSLMVFEPWRSLELSMLENSEFSKAFMCHKSCLYNFINKIIKSKCEESYQPTEGKPLLFIDIVLDLYRNGQFSSKDVVDESLLSILAASETSSEVIYFALLCLAMHPDLQDKVYDEVSNIIDKDSNVTNKDISEMVYTELVANEAMRLFPPAVIIGREVSQDMQLHNGIVLPKGLNVALDIFNMHRDESIWGSDAAKFDPDRFLPENISGRSPYAYIPFLRGLRTCVGRKYGLIMVKLALAKILLNFRLSTTFKYADLTPVFDLTFKLKEYPLIEIYHR